MKLALVVLALAALVAPAADADWLQDGGDPGHTGYLVGGGPTSPSVALRVAAPEGGWAPAPPLLRGRDVLVATWDGVYAVSIDDGVPRELARMGAQVFQSRDPVWAADDERVYLVAPGADGGGLGGSLLQSIPLDGSPPTVVQLSGEQGVLDWCAIALDDLAYVGCVGGPGPVGGNAVLQAYAPTGERAWTWSSSTDPHAASRSDQYVDQSQGLNYLMSVTAVDGYVIPILGGEAYRTTSSTGEPVAPAFQWTGWKVNTTTKSVDARPLPAVAPPAIPFFPPYDGAIFGTGFDGSTRVGSPHHPAPVVANDRLEIRKLPSFRDDMIVQLRPLGAPIVNVTIAGPDSGSSPAIAGERIYTGGGEFLLALDDQARVLWRVEQEGRSFGRTPLLADDERVYAFEQNLGGGAYSLHAFDAATGRELWRHDLNSDVGSSGWTPSFVAGGEGVIALLDPPNAGSGSTLDLVIIGETSASIRLAPSVSDAYPQPASPIRVDLSGAAPGIHGAPTEYRIDWGDGETTPWQGSPLFEHAYANVGDHTARAYASNEAGQTSVASFDVHVGQEPPDFLAAQFSPANQERTFFLLGLAITGIFAGAGLLRVQRRRTLLARELHALDHEVRAAGDDPVRVDRALDERRFRARGLLTDRKLDEGQHAVLAARIEELSRSARIDVVDHTLGFLPHRHVLALREMLRDGRVSSLERAHFLRLLEEDTMLTEEYKARVRAVVDGWTAHDGAAGGAR